MKYLNYFMFFVWLPFFIVMALFFSPKVEGLGESTRVFYFHVPVAWVAVLSFFYSAWYSGRYLRKLDIHFDIKADSAARLGLLFSGLATISGSMWAKITWGEYWHWDPRETSILILLFIYLAYFSLRNSIESDEKRASLAAVYSLVAFATVPILVFLIPRIFESLHPDPIINERGKIDMGANIRFIFYGMVIGFIYFFFILKRLQEKILRLTQKKYLSLLKDLQKRA
jgi:heme exporter protein C